MTPFGLRKRLRAYLEGRPVARAPAVAPPPDVPDEPPLEVEAPIPGSLLLDIREPGEMAQGVAEGAMLLPMELVPHHIDELPRDRAITVYCAAGARSYGVATWLREQGFPEAASLAGGTWALRAAGVAMVVPEGTGERVRVPADAVADGALSGTPLSGEVLRRDGDAVIVVVRDAQGLPVRVRARLAR